MMTRSGFLPDRTIHLHPTRRCNLACAHCYSRSSPYAEDALAFDMVESALTALRGEGYEVLSLSGGEPLLFPRLDELADRAHELGYRVVAISNGYRVKPAHDELLRRFDGMAISFDGMGEPHNRMRGRADAYNVAIAALRHLRAIDVPAAAAFTVSRESIGDVPDFVELVASLGVRAVQLRPLVMAGRAIDKCGDAALSAADLSRLFLIGAGLADAWLGEVAVHTDLAPASALAEQRHAYAALLDGGRRGCTLAELVNPLVITPDGAVKPFTYDFPAPYDLGTVEALVQRGPRALTGNVLALRHLIRGVFDDLAGRGDLVDWFAHCRDEAQARAPAFAT